jgi:hypothetical protein
MNLAPLCDEGTRNRNGERGAAAAESPPSCGSTLVALGPSPSFLDTKGITRQVQSPTGLFGSKSGSAPVEVLHRDFKPEDHVVRPETPDPEVGTWLG